MERRNLMNQIVSIVELEESETKELWVNALPLGTFYDPRYGEVKITKEIIRQMAENFKNNIPHYPPPVNIAHNDELGGYGIVKDLEARNDGLYALLELTEEGKKLLEEQKFRFVSSEFTSEYQDKKSGKKVGSVFLGLALTNRPAHPGVQEIQLGDDVTMVKLAVVNVPAWKLEPNAEWVFDWARDADEIIQKFGWQALAQACGYVDMSYEKGESGYPEVKAAYKLPFAKVTDNQMVIYRRGVIAAMQALLGARGGVDVPREEKERVYAKLAAIYKQLDMEPPEFHYEEQQEAMRMEEEKEIVRLQEELQRTLSENQKLLQEKAELKKKYEELAKEKLLMELSDWAAEWVRKGVKPVVVEKAKAVLLEDVSKKQVFDSMFMELQQPMGQMGETAATPSEITKADQIAKAVWGGA